MSTLNDRDCNCTYTNSDKKQCKVSIEALLKLMDSIPERPKIYTMQIELIRMDLMPENWIILSKSVADALDEAMKGNKHE